jgi:hypothetical protein
MVQLKYYGDNRDYFKYDLISFILDKTIFTQYGFVPMLTEHRYDNEGNILPAPSDCKSKELLKFISAHSIPNLNNWELWLSKYVSSYYTIHPINTTYINTCNRVNYWNKFQSVIDRRNSLVFFDPDTGIQTGRKTPIDKKEYEKYILNDEISNLINKLSTSSMFVIYQHLQKNSKKHDEDIKTKYESLAKIDENLNVSIYREKDLAFIFITKDKSIYKSVNNALVEYNNRSTVSPKSLVKNT